MTLQQLKYVVMVAEKGSISEAAKALYISQPSLTSAVHELEKEMQLTIFHRTNKGVIITGEGEEFLGYARQVLDQAGLLEDKYKKGHTTKQRFSISTQHYSFAVNAFVDVIRELGGEQYDFTLRETQTYEIIEDVSCLKSEIGILYTCTQNQTVLTKLIASHGLKFQELFTARPHVFISAIHPLSQCKEITLEELKDYPYLSFEQGNYNSFYFSEEILSTLDREKNIKVRDRATLFNLVIGLNGYTVSTGILSKELNGEHIIAKPLSVEEPMHIGVITQANMTMSRMGQAYMDALYRHIC